MTLCARDLAALFMTFALAGCSAEPRPTVQLSPSENGKMLFEDPALSLAGQNVFSCATCHITHQDPLNTKILPGANLAGAIFRATFWGGQERSILRAMNDCRFYFMNDSKAWRADNQEAGAIYAYLASLPPDLPNAVTFTVIASVVDLPAGDPARGASVHARACAGCHGDIHTGNGRLASRIPVLPEDTVFAHLYYPHDEQRLVFIEKLRHGTFFGYGGDMPPFSPQVLPDADVSDLLSAYNLY